MKYLSGALLLVVAQVLIGLALLYSGVISVAFVNNLPSISPEAYQTPTQRQAVQNQGHGREAHSR